MTRNLRIGIVLFVLGVAGFLYIADKLFLSYSGLWYATVIAFLIVAVVGLVFLWKELGWKGREPVRKRKELGRVGKELGQVGKELGQVGKELGRKRQKRQRRR